MKRVIYLCACLFIFSVAARVVEEWDMAGGGPWGRGVGGWVGDLRARMLECTLQSVGCLVSELAQHGAVKTAKRRRECAVHCVMHVRCKCLNRYSVKGSDRSHCEVAPAEQNHSAVILFHISFSFVCRPVHQSKEGSGRDGAAADGTVTWATCIMIDGPPVLVFLLANKFGLCIMFYTLELGATLAKAAPVCSFKLLRRLRSQI